MRDALSALKKFHPTSLGVVAIRDVLGGLHKQINLSVRLLCWHYEQCAKHTKVWALAKR